MTVHLVLLVVLMCVVTQMSFYLCVCVCVSLSLSLSLIYIYIYIYICPKLFGDQC